MAKKSRKTQGFIKYKTYLFQDKDPVIDVMRTMKRDTEFTDKELADKSGVSVTTIKSWFGGHTKRPQFATVAAVAVAMGYDNIPVTAGRRSDLKKSTAAQWVETGNSKAH